MPKPVCHSNLPAVKVEETCGCRWMCPCEYLSMCASPSPSPEMFHHKCTAEWSFSATEHFKADQDGRNCCLIVAQWFKKIIRLVRASLMLEFLMLLARFRATLSLVFALLEWQCFIRESHTQFPKLGWRMCGSNQEFILTSCKQAMDSWSILGLEGLACPQSSKCSTKTSTRNSPCLQITSSRASEQKGWTLSDWCMGWDDWNRN